MIKAGLAMYGTSSVTGGQGVPCQRFCTVVLLLQMSVLSVLSYGDIADSCDSLPKMVAVSAADTAAVNS
jgi:hypothetical protein